MKTCALYGFIIALADSLLVLVLFFLGFHSDPAKLVAAGLIGSIAALAIGIIVTVLGVKARRSEIPATQDFGYGSALWAGVQISAVACFLASIFDYVYNAFINPGLADIIVEAQMEKIQSKGLSGDQADKVEKMYRFMQTPGVHAVTALIGGFIFAFIISLIVAAFLKRPALAAPGQPPVQS
jgi:Protein of unknown function (DUF4199)